MIKTEIKNHIGVLTLDNPKTLNAIDFEVLYKFNEELEKIKKSKDIKCLIITGAGDKAFVAGGDIIVQNTFDVIKAYNWACLGHSTLRKLETLHIPVIGAINGYALGGGTEVALACDILIASEKAVFGQPEVCLGIIPGFGGTQRLPRKVGTNKAKELILTGRKFNAEEAMRIGLVNKVVQHKDLITESIKMAEEIIKNSTMAVRFAKAAVEDGIECDLDRGLSLERGLFSQCFDTEEQKKAMSAFIEERRRKREPV